MKSKFKKVLPKNKRDILPWINNFVSKITAISKSANIPDAQNSAALAALQQVVTAMATAIAAMLTAQKANTAKDQLIDDCNEILYPLIVAIMASPVWSDAMKKDLGIGFTKPSFDAGNFKATLKADVVGNTIVIKMGKTGIKANNLYTKLQSETNWTLIEKVLLAKYVYSKPLTVAGMPQIIQFMCRGVENDKEIGQQSDIVTVTFGG